ARGTVRSAPTEKWWEVDLALRRALRGLPGGSSLSRLLRDRLGVEHHLKRPALNVKTILQWAKQHHARTGSWPTGDSGEIHDAPGETWRAVDAALTKGTRGLPGGDSIARILQRAVGRPLWGRTPL